MSIVPDLPLESSDRSLFMARGWAQFMNDDGIARWLTHTRSAILATPNAPEHQEWWRYQRTWFAGVNVLENDSAGAIAGGPALKGKTVDFAYSVGPERPPAWDKAQVSVCRAGYPQPMEGESDGVFRFRRDRDAAHLDGLLKEGARRRRSLKEFHTFILGIPASNFSEGAAPFTVWEGSQHLVSRWLRETFSDIPKAEWAHMDLTDAYQKIRQEIFETCPRVIIPAHTGAPFVVHRFALHGMSRWEDGARADPEGRVIVYFRPPTDDLTWWLHGD